MGNSQNTRVRPIRFGIQAQLGGGPINGGAIAGIALVVGGSLLFIDNLGIFPFALTDAFWPIILLLLSGLGLYRTCSPAIRILCGAGIAAAALLILGTFHVIRVTSEIIWPLVMIAIGMVLLVYRLRWPAFGDRVSLGTSSKTSISDNKLVEAAVFSAVNRRVETPAFEGGELNTVFGSIEVDLRRAGVTAPDPTIVIEANAVFGGIEIRVPENWRLRLQGSAVFGTYEDKTIPPRPEPGVAMPTLLIRGGTAFGSVVIRN